MWPPGHGTQGVGSSAGGRDGQVLHTHEATGGGLMGAEQDDHLLPPGVGQEVQYDLAAFLGEVE